MTVGQALRSLGVRAIVSLMPVAKERMVSNNNSYLRPLSMGCASEAPPCARPGRHSSPPQWVPLSELQRGEVGVLRHLAGGRGLRARALALGLVPGTPLSVIQAIGGSAVIAVRGSRLALGRRMAERVWVERVSAPATTPVPTPGVRTPEPGAAVRSQGWGRPRWAAM